MAYKDKKSIYIANRFVLHMLAVFLATIKLALLSEHRSSLKQFLWLQVTGFYVHMCTFSICIYC